MLSTILLFALGLLLLIQGGNWFVDGATGIAKELKVPELIIGATIVSLGTTLPEVIVSTEAAIIGSGGIAYGNAIGSIICNTALICALVCLFSPKNIESDNLINSSVFFFGAATFYSFIAYFFSFIRLVGIILLLIFVLYTYINIKCSILKSKSCLCKMNTEEEYDEESNFCKLLKFIKNNTIRQLIILGVGIALVVIGANMLVSNGTLIAEKLNVPESVIGLTVIALGTSLPELVTAITAIRKGHPELSIGNVIGANLFNLVYVSGLAITISPFNIPCEKLIYGMNASLIIDLPLMFLVMMILVLPIFFFQKTAKWQGIALLMLYFGYLVVQFML